MIFQPIISGGSTAPTAPNEIKFYPNPAIYDYIVDRNGDDLSGTGNSGTLRYCMTNCAAGAVIVFSGVLIDSARSGDIETIKITSSLVSKNCTIYGNGKYITIPVSSSFPIAPVAIYINFYSLHFRDFIAHSAAFGASSSFVYAYGCKFYNLNTTIPYYFQYGIRYNCEFVDCKYLYMSNSISSQTNTYEKCNFINNATIYVVAQGSAVIDSCYFYGNTGNAICGCIQPGTLIKNCFSTFKLIDKCNALVYNNIIYNAIIGGGALNNVYTTIYHNTIVNESAASAILSCPSTTTGVTINFKNNLVITPVNTFLINQDTIATITESGNIYMGLNSDPKFPNSLRFTGDIEQLIWLKKIKQTIDGVNRDYYTPKGAALQACSSIAGYETDYRGTARDATCDCGAIEI